VALRAVLFDVGGPIDMEVEYERLLDVAIRDSLASYGVDITDDDYASAWRSTVDSFAPDAYRSVIWRLLAEGTDVADLVYARTLRQRRLHGSTFELRVGIPQLMRLLRGHGLFLDLAANQPESIIEVLKTHGLHHYLHSSEVSDTIGIRKPDTRLFLRACESLAVTPDETIMVGDRIDNDIFPAKSLGMKTVRIVTGRHRKQRPRFTDEVPDAKVHDTAGLQAAILTLCG